jgi:hypothetical protein
MSYPILQSSTQSALLFFLTDETDHISPLTGASPTVTLSKNGGSFASPSGAVSEIGSGWYKVAGNATDTGTLGPLALHATATGADPCDIIVALIVAYDPQSATSLGLTNLDATVSSRLATASYTAPPSAADNADAVWDEALAGHVASGSAGEALTAAGSAGDPWSTALPGAYTSGQAGYLLGQLTLAGIADGILNRDMATGTDSGSDSVRTVRQALRFLRNKWAVSGGAITVYKEDDSTASWTAVLGTTAGANPVTSLDPAGP